MNIALELQFLRAVGTKTIVDAIVDALQSDGDAYAQALTRFKTILLDSIGPSGLHSGDQIAFLFDDEEGIQIRVRGVPAGEVMSRRLRHNLLGIYAGEKTLIPDLRSSLMRTLS